MKRVLHRSPASPAAPHSPYCPYFPYSLHLPLLALLAAFCLSAAGASAQAPTKKLIEYGWDVPAPSYIRDNIRQMEQRPFEGLILRVPQIGSVFANKKWDEPAVAGEFKALEQIGWRRFTDNFIIMYAASTMDWFSDADWECVLHNVALCAKAAKVGRCKGICFDAEPYGANPWQYKIQKHAGEKSFDEYQAIARKRGAQFLAKIQETLPAPVIHTFFQLSYFGAIAAVPDPAERTRKLSQEGYGLLPAFLNGMLDAANPETVITDGNESSYYYTEAKPFYESFYTIRQTGLGLVAPENRRKYLAQVQCSQALYVDYLFKYWPHATPATYMSAEERARWFEHNTYWALKTADEYVWLYSEKMNWWTNKDLPPGLQDAIVAAKEKLAKRAPLDFSMAAIMERAQAEQERVLVAKMVRREADIPRLAGGAPTVDGNLDDAAWSKAKALDPFRLVAGQDKVEPKAATEARVAYDDQCLYLSVRCQEPAVAKVDVAGTRRDDDVWQGDSVDLFLAAGPKRTPFHHIIVNPKGVRWDGMHGEEVDLSWSPDYQCAASIGADFWSMELAIPWSAFKGVTARRGAKLFANVCRQRRTDSEISSWSVCGKGFVEPERFGTWTLK